jgi:fucose 4-O-acetylase-like acetyltransferase
LGVAFFCACFQAVYFGFSAKKSSSAQSSICFSSRLVVTLHLYSELFLMKQRNTTISIVKGIAIILMVIGHAECPGLLLTFIYEFHMPIFFITAGYFFSRRNIDNPWDFCAKRFKGLYLPFVKWSIFFLVIHNLLFHFGILNEQFGNWSGGVTHPYSLSQALQRLVNIVFSMAGYDEFLAGAFWFFRALLISSILFLILYRLLDGRSKWLHGSNVAIVIVLAAIAFAAFRISNGLKVTTVVQGGIRENWGVIFFGIGMIYRNYEAKLREYWWLSLIFCALLVGGATIPLGGMSLAPNLHDAFVLPLTGTIGFLMVHQVSAAIDRHDNFIKQFLAFCGENTLYIFVFHISAFKLVSLLKIWIFNLPFAEVGCHMVVHEPHDWYFWIFYTIVGVGLPLAWIWSYRRIKSNVVARRLAKTERHE